MSEDELPAWVKPAGPAAEPLAAYLLDRTDGEQVLPPVNEHDKALLSAYTTWLRVRGYLTRAGSQDRGSSSAASPS